MNNLSRSLVGMIAASMLVFGLGFWFAFDSITPLFAFTADNPLARAGIRGDIGGLFLILSGLTAYAAVNQSVPAARFAAIMFIVALSGRIMTVLLEGAVPGGLAPMLVEATSAALLLWASYVWVQQPALAEPITA